MTSIPTVCSPQARRRRELRSHPSRRVVRTFPPGKGERSPAQRWPLAGRSVGQELVHLRNARGAKTGLFSICRSGELSRQQARLVGGAVANKRFAAPQLELARSASMRELLSSLGAGYAAPTVRLRSPGGRTRAHGDAVS